MSTSTAPKIIFILVVLALFAASSFGQLPGKMRIIHIDVGQGDATLILTGNGDAIDKAVLFDAGNVPGVEAEEKDAGKIISDVLAEYELGHLDYLITSHYDHATMGGIVGGTVHAGTSFLDDGIVIKNWIDRGSKNLGETTGTYDKWVDRKKAAIKKGCVATSITKQSQVDEFKIDLGQGITMTCVAANGMVNGVKDVDMAVASPNALSLCFLLQAGDFDYLIGGDLIGRKTGKQEDAKIEDAVGTYCTNNSVKVDVLHVNNHGGNTSSSKAFLQKIKAKTAIISAGQDPRLKHPHAKALLRLSESSVEAIYQTDAGNGDLSKIEPAALSAIQGKQKVANGHIVVDVTAEGYEISGGELAATKYKFH